MKIDSLLRGHILVKNQSFRRSRGPRMGAWQPDDQTRLTVKRGGSYSTVAGGGEKKRGRVKPEEVRGAE